MAILKPFQALRPISDKAEQVSCVPYDVVYESEVRDFIARHPLSFLRVTRAEGEFPTEAKPTTEEIFARARQNLDWYVSQNIYARDDVPAYYIYQLSAGDQVQTGVVGCCSLDDYESGIIKKHENVRPDKVQDRTAHLLAVQAQTGLIFLAFRNTDLIRGLIRQAIQFNPIYSFVCMDGVTHKVWRVIEVAPFAAAFNELQSLYIADGHHRVESAKLARDTMRMMNAAHTGLEDYNYVLAGVFPAEDLQILPYNRAVRDLHGLSSEGFFKMLEQHFTVQRSVSTVPARHGELCMYFGSQWYTLSLKNADVVENDPISRLDVSILQDFLLAPILGIADPRTDDRLVFIGGARGTTELQAMVDRGDAMVAFSMFPTTMDDLLAVSDLGMTMPPKSTWFEPKLKDGLLVHQI